MINEKEKLTGLDKIQELLFGRVIYGDEEYTEKQKLNEKTKE